MEYTLLTYSGWNIVYGQVAITGGAEKLQNLAACTTTSSGSASASTGISQVYKVVIIPGAAALLAGAFAEISELMWGGRKSTAFYVYSALTTVRRSSVLPYFQGTSTVRSRSTRTSTVLSRERRTCHNVELRSSFGIFDEHHQLHVSTQAVRHH